MNFTRSIHRYLTARGLRRINLRAALIDMDGTLYDSMPRHADAWHTMMAEIGVELPREEVFLHEGRTGAGTINILFRRAFGRDATPEEIERLYHRKTELFAAMPQVSPMPGAARMLSILEEHGIDRVLVTGSGQNSLISRLDTDFPGAFLADMRVTARDVTRGKPAPDPFIAAMAKAGVSPAESMVIENAPLGVEAGAASGAFTIGVNTGPIPPSVLSEAGADIVFDSMNDFAGALPALLRDLASIENTSI